MGGLKTHKLYSCQPRKTGGVLISMNKNQVRQAWESARRSRQKEGKNGTLVCLIVDHEVVHIPWTLLK